MKRRLVIEEFDGHSAPALGPLQRLKSFFFSSAQTQDFYPASQKRRLFEDSTVIRSIAFTNGQLYAGCKGLDCYNMCVPIQRFCPTEPNAMSAFHAFLQTHDDAVAARDLQVAMEFRRMVELKRRSVCSKCYEDANLLMSSAEPVHEREAQSQASTNAIEEQPSEENGAAPENAGEN